MWIVQHMQGIIHCDLADKNILLGSGVDVKIAELRQTIIYQQGHQCHGLHNNSAV